MTAKRTVRCAIYTRKSTEEGLEQDFNSLDAQREACEAYIISQKAEGWLALNERYDDGGYSGGTLERPALKQLLKDIEDGAVDVVVVYKIDRLSRSLMDFAKLVEVFDRRSVTFVSVTQSFNTTTSMGRLTLNVLLSFAQFEREVTGERIRDKIAASKRKGIWMGGNPPLGYDVANRKLVINETEAETVRFIFQRYLELGSARLLCADLAKRKIVSKRRTFAGGKKLGGKPIGESALYALLNNRIFIGQTTHKGASYRGEHDGIVPKPLFESVQLKLAENGPKLSRKARAVQDALFAGLVFDEAGTRMVPNYAVKVGVRYRYYVSGPTLKGQRSQSAITRIPAPPFEDLVASTIARLGFAGDETRPLIRRIDVLTHSIVIRLDRDVAFDRSRSLNRALLRDRDIEDDLRSRLVAGETLNETRDSLDIALPVRAKFRGGRASILFPPSADSETPSLNLALIKAVARAHRWREMLMNADVDSIETLAKRFSLDRGHTGLTLKLGFLSPSITLAILEGRQPSGLRLTDLLAADIPLSWDSQADALSNIAQNGVSASLSGAGALAFRKPIKPVSRPKSRKK